MEWNGMEWNGMEWNGNGMNAWCAQRSTAQWSAATRSAAQTRAHAPHTHTAQPLSTRAPSFSCCSCVTDGVALLRLSHAVAEKEKVCLTTDSTFEDFLDVLPTAFEAVSLGQGVLEGRTGPRGSEHFKAKPRFSGDSEGDPNQKYLATSLYLAWLCWCWRHAACTPLGTDSACSGHPFPSIKSLFVVAESVIGRPQNTSSWTGSESECRDAVCVCVLRNSTFIP